MPVGSAAPRLLHLLPSTALPPSAALYALKVQVTTPLHSLYQYLRIYHKLLCLSSIKPKSVSSGNILNKLYGIADSFNILYFFIGNFNAELFFY